MYTRQVGMIELKTLRSWLISYKRVSLLMMELAVAFCCQTDKKREREREHMDRDSLTILVNTR